LVRPEETLKTGDFYDYSCFGKSVSGRAIWRDHNNRIFSMVGAGRGKFQPIYILGKAVFFALFFNPNF
jgi:hypothetical protein